MPTLHRERGYRFWFWPGDGAEPPHVHVEGNGGRAKIWLAPGVRIAKTRGYTHVQLNDLQKITERKRHDFREAWRAYFG